MQNMTSVHALCAFSRNRNIVEDRLKKSSYSIKEFEIVMNRSKLAFLGAKSFREYERFVINFHYPRFSYFCMIVSDVRLYPIHA